MIGRWLFWLPVGICAALAPCSAIAANGIPENADGDPCGGIRPCDLGGNFTIDEMVKQKPYPIRGVCESRCFWQAVVTNSCFYPDAVIDVHALSTQAPASSTDWRPISSFLRRNHPASSAISRTAGLAIGSHSSD